jgi:hypothetical protein
MSDSSSLSRTLPQYWYVVCTSIFRAQHTLCTWRAIHFFQGVLKDTGIMHKLQSLAIGDFIWGDASYAPRLGGQRRI